MGHNDSAATANRIQQGKVLFSRNEISKTGKSGLPNTTQKLLLTTYVKCLH